jgi:hypothetical protein
MPTRLLPLFPLQVVVFPRTPLPLHIFEERYKEMVGSALLRHRSETTRLKELNQYLANYIPRQRAIDRMKELAPTNGFGGKPAGL